MQIPLYLAAMVPLQKLAVMVGLINRLIELGLGKECYAIRGLHLNELPLMHVFRDADGKTKGRSSFKGPIGSLIQGDLTQFPLVQFEIVPGLVKYIDNTIQLELSTDQKYLYEISLEVQEGPEYVSNNLLNRNSGTLHQARWCTLANRVIRLYICTTHPNTILKVPVYFQFKDSCTLSNTEVTRRRLCDNSASTTDKWLLGS